MPTLSNYAFSEGHFFFAFDVFAINILLKNRAAAKSHFVFCNSPVIYVSVAEIFHSLIITPSILNSTVSCAFLISLSHVCTILNNICDCICQCTSDIRVICTVINCRNFSCKVYDIFIYFLSTIEIRCFLINFRFSCR